MPIAKSSIYQYRAAKWADMAKDFSTAKSIKDEIGVLRLLLQERLATCEDSHDLMLASPTLADLVDKIAKVVTSCQKLEHQQGQLIDKDTLFGIADEMITIISEYVDDTKLPILADRIFDLLTSASKVSIKKAYNQPVC